MNTFHCDEARSYFSAVGYFYCPCCVCRSIVVLNLPRSARILIGQRETISSRDTTKRISPLGGAHREKKDLFSEHLSMSRLLKAHRKKCIF